MNEWLLGIDGGRLLGDGVYIVARSIVIGIV